MFRRMLKNIDLFNLLAVFSIMFTEADAVYVCEGDNVKLFSNTFINPDEESHLNLYHDKMLIVYWTTNKPDNNTGHEKQVERDQNYDIWLYNVSTKDQGQYFLLYRKWKTEEPRRVLMDGELLISRCKPFINAVKNGPIYFLIATLPVKECGMLNDALIWTLPWNNSRQNTSMIQVNSMEKPGLYKVCIGGPDMKCVNRADPCAEFNVSKNESLDTEKLNPSVDNEKNQTIWIIIAIVLCIVVATVGLIAFFCCKRIACQKGKLKSKDCPEEIQKGSNLKISPEQVQPLLKSDVPDLVQQAGGATSGVIGLYNEDLQKKNI